MRRIVKALGALACSAMLAGSASAAIVINFPNFSNCSTLQLNANAACTSNVLRVTPAQFSQAGSAFSQLLIPLGPGNTFSTFFTFQITGSGGRPTPMGLVPTASRSPCNRMRIPLAALAAASVTRAS